MISKKHKITLVKQCEALCIARSSYYYQAKAESEENLNIMKDIDKLHLKQPFLGVRRITDELRLLGYEVNHKLLKWFLFIMTLAASAAAIFL